MLTLDGAEELIDRHLGATPRAAHSRAVGRIMERLAGRLAGDPMLWRLVGLCHDLDYFVTGEDRSRHGIVASEWLAGELPAEALVAIEAHDHRTGVSSRDVLSDMLKLADAAALVCETLEAHAVRGIDPGDLEECLTSHFGDRPHLPDMLFSIARRHGIGHRLLADICIPSDRG